MGSDFQKGLFLNAGAGFKYFVTERICMNTSVGYNYQQMHLNSIYKSNGDIRTDEFFNAPANIKNLSLQVGLHFQLAKVNDPSTELMD